MPELLHIVYYIIISVFIIVFAHYSFNYLKYYYSKETTKDVFGFQSQKYKEILDELHTISSTKSKLNIIDPVVDFDFDFNTMEIELLEFAKSKLSSHP